MIHPTAMIEENVLIGEESDIWDHAHIRFGSEIGRHCMIGEKTYIAYEVKIGDFVKINSMVYICHGVTIEKRCMISAGVVFTNDRSPRSCLPDQDKLFSSYPTDDQEILKTLVKTGTTIGANATIGPGLTLGRYCMVGMGAVVTKDVPDHALVAGNPAKCLGHVCVCGKKLEGNLCPTCERVIELSYA